MSNLESVRASSFFMLALHQHPALNAIYSIARLIYLSKGRASGP